MNLELSSVHGQGKASEEFVILTVLRDCDLQYYMLADTTFVGPGNISNKTRHSYWWAPCTVKSGDKIVLLTGVGADTKEAKSGFSIHIFYWNLGTAVWNNTGDAAVLFNVAAWKTVRA